MRLVAIGLIAGFFSALLGVGGGIVVVPLLILWLSFETRTATADATPSATAGRQRTLPYRAWRHVPAATVGRIASSEVPVAWCWSRPRTTSIGTKRMPPPTPNMPANPPATSPSTIASA